MTDATLHWLAWVLFLRIIRLYRYYSRLPAYGVYDGLQKTFWPLCYLIEDTETDRGAEAMRVIMVLLAYLDGARAWPRHRSGKARVEKQLTLLEKAKGPLA